MEFKEQFIDRSRNSSPNRPENDQTAIPAPDDPPWATLEAIGLWIASVLFIVVVPTIFLLPYLAFQNPPIADSERLVEFAKSDQTAIILQIVAILPAHILTLSIAWLVVTRVRRFSFSETLGWTSGGVRWWHYCSILIAFLLIAAGVGYFFPEQENDLIRILRSSRMAVYIVALVATFTAPLVEEVIYRGVLYSAFQRALGIPAAFILVTFLFALVHVPQYYPSFSTIFLLALLSLTLTAIRVISGNLLPCIILHTLFNGLQSVLLIIEPLVNTTTQGEATVTIFHFLK